MTDDGNPNSSPAAPDSLELHDAVALPLPAATALGLDRAADRPSFGPAPEPSIFAAEPSLADLLAHAVADKLERDPSLLCIPIENIDRWLNLGVLSNPAWYLRWRALLNSARTDAVAFDRVLEVLRSGSEEARRWRDFSPFAGLLSSSERRKIIRQCSYSH